MASAASILFRMVFVNPEPYTKKYKSIPKIGKAIIIKIQVILIEALVRLANTPKTMTIETTLAKMDAQR